MEDNEVTNVPPPPPEDKKLLNEHFAPGPAIGFDEIDINLQSINVYAIWAKPSSMYYVCRTGYDFVLYKDAIMLAIKTGPNTDSPVSGAIGDEMIKRSDALRQFVYKCTHDRKLTVEPVAYPLPATSVNTVLPFASVVGALSVPITAEHEAWFIEGDEQTCLQRLLSRLHVENGRLSGVVDSMLNKDASGASVRM